MKDHQRILDLFASDQASDRSQAMAQLEALGDDAWDFVFKDCTVDEWSCIKGDLPWSDELLCSFLSRPERILADRDEQVIHGLRLSSLHKSLDAERLGKLNCLACCPELTHLDLSDLQVGKALEGVAACTKLQYLGLFADVPRDTLAKIAKLLPECTIDRCGPGHSDGTTRYGPAMVFCWLDPEGPTIRIGGAVRPIYSKGKLQTYFWIGYGYAGGGCQEDACVRVDFTDDDCNKKQGDLGLDDYHFGYRYDGEWNSSDVDFDEMPLEDTRMFSALCDVMDTDYEYSEEIDWMVPKEDFISGMWPYPAGTRETALFYWSNGLSFPLHVGLATPNSFSSSWSVPEDIEAARIEPPTVPYFGVDGAVGPHRFIMSTFCDLTEYEKLVEGVEDNLAAAYAEQEDVKKVFEVLKAIALAAGLTAIQTKVNVEYEALELFGLSHCSLYNTDGAFLRGSGEHNICFLVSDYDSFLRQIYDCGDYDTGSISCLEEPELYTKCVSDSKRDALASFGITD